MTRNGETQPLLSDGSNTKDIHRTATNDTIVVDFADKGDPDNPLEWPRAYKWGVVGLLAFMAFTVTFTCISVVPVADRIVKDLNHSDHNDKSASVLLVTIWELGEAAGPLFIGPLSELFGRRYVLNIGTVLFVAATVLGAVCQTTHLFIAARCLTGAAVTSNVLNPAIVGDIYPPEERGAAMSLVILAPLIGGAIGPAISGAIAERFGWRRVLWIAAALATSCEVVFLCCFRETYSPVILRRRAEKVARETGNDDCMAKCDIESAEDSSKEGFWHSIARPFKIVTGSFVLQIFSIYGGMTFTYFYIITTTLPDILENIYELSPSLTGLCFLSFSIGSVLSVSFCNLALDRIYVYYKKRNEGIGLPEFRLPLVIFGSLTMPPVVAALGWLAQGHAPLPALLVFVGLLGMFMLLGYLPVMAYVVDALGVYSASGMTATIVTRCLAGTFFPLSTEPLVEKFGYGWAFTILGAISLALAPIPMLLFKYGEKWRSRSEYTRQVQST